MVETFFLLYCICILLCVCFIHTHTVFCFSAVPSNTLLNMRTEDNISILIWGLEDQLRLHMLSSNGNNIKRTFNLPVPCDDFKNTYTFLYNANLKKKNHYYWGNQKLSISLIIVFLIFSSPNNLLSCASNHENAL